MHGKVLSWLIAVELAVLLAAGVVWTWQQARADAPHREESAAPAAPAGTPPGEAPDDATPAGAAGPSTHTLATPETLETPELPPTAQATPSAEAPPGVGNATQPNPAAGRGTDAPQANASGAHDAGPAAAANAGPAGRAGPTSDVGPLPPAELPAALRRPRVLILKRRGVLRLYDGGRLVAAYPAVVGREPGDKRREGDRRTPEGAFYICLRKGRGQTPYTRSLGLSYPALDDARRGLREGLIGRDEYEAIADAHVRRARPPWDTALGGEIMIHGRRRLADGSVRDSTLGCIAVDDAVIRALYPLLPLGTPVEIRP